MDNIKMITSIIEHYPLSVGRLTIYYKDKGELLDVTLSNTHIILENKEIVGTYWYTTYDNIMTYSIIRFKFGQFGKTWWLEKPEGEIEDE